jgi:hypothetical protein
MRNNKQSSIEWLAQQLYEQMEMCGDGNVYDKIIKQAKLIHKQEIVDAYYGELYYESTSNGKHYYNETFGDNNMGENNGEITRMNNNIPDTNEGNTNTTGNISNTWGGDTSSITGNISNTWGSDRLNVNGNVNAWSGGHIKNGTIISDRTGTKTEDDNRIKAEKQIWDRTVNWDIMNKYTRANDEEQSPYNVKTNVVTRGKTDDGTLAVIEITIDIKQR